MKKRILYIQLMCIIMLGILCGCCGGADATGGCKNPDELIKTYVRYYFDDVDASKIYNLVYEDMRPVILEESEEEDNYLGVDEIIDGYQEALNWWHDWIIEMRRRLEVQI